MLSRRISELPGRAEWFGLSMRSSARIAMTTIGARARSSRNVTQNVSSLITFASLRGSDAFGLKRELGGLGAVSLARWNALAVAWSQLASGTS